MTPRSKCLVAAIFSALLAAPIFLINLGDPKGLFWDENYHIPSAQRYLTGVFFMEPHPPLGKLLLALGEYLLDENVDDSSAAGFEKAASMPDGFSFRSYRIPSAVAGWLAAPVLAWGLTIATSSAALGFFLSTLYIFENAIVLHSRGAMLDSFVSMFMAIFLALWFLARKNPSVATTILAGIAFGLGISTKLNFIFLLPLLLTFGHEGENLKSRASRVFGISLVSAFVFLGTFWVHLSLSKRVINTLPDSGWYETSTEYRELISTSSNPSIKTLALTIKEWLLFSSRYQKGVPELNYCKDEENGSFPLLWPLGARSINYKWEVKNEIFRILYLQVNPLIYLVALAGLVVGGSWLVTLTTNRGSSDLLGFKAQAAPLIASYLLYLGACLIAGRVFYLYHYFVPWILSLFVLALVLKELSTASAFPFLLSIFSGIVFYIYSPLTYYGEVTTDEINKLGLLPLWNLHTPNLPSQDPIARPITGDPHRRRVDPSWSLSIGSLKANYIEQEWGTPRLNSTDDGSEISVKGVIYKSGFGVHAKSRIQFDLSGKYRELRIKYGVPDRHSTSKTSVVFKILGDGKLKHESSVVRKGDGDVEVKVDLTGVEVLALLVEATKDGNDSDHAVWIDPQLY